MILKHGHMPVLVPLNLFCLALRESRSRLHGAPSFVTKLHASSSTSITAHVVVGPTTPESLVHILQHARPSCVRSFILHM